MTQFDVKVSTRRFRGALISVLPHVSTDKDDVFLTRVRVYVSAEHLVVAATDRFTAAMAWLPVDESTGEVGCVVRVNLLKQRAIEAERDRLRGVVHAMLQSFERGGGAVEGPNGTAHLQSIWVPESMFEGWRLAAEGGR